MVVWLHILGPYGCLYVLFGATHSLTQSTAEWVPGLSRGKEQPERDADPSLPSSAVVKKK